MSRPLRPSKISVIFGNGTLLDQINKGEFEIVQERIRFLTQRFAQVHLISQTPIDPSKMIDLSKRGKILVHSPKKNLQRIGNTLFLLYASIRIINLFKENVNLIRAYGLPASLPAVLVKRIIPRMRLIMSYHYEWSTQRFQHNRLLFTVAQLLESAVFKAADLIIVLNPRLERCVTARGIDQGKVKVVPNWVDTSRFNPREDGSTIREAYSLKKIVLLYVGRLHPVKNLEIAVGAVSKLVEVNPNLSFLIVGEGPQKQKLQELALELKISEHVVFAGTIAHQELPKFYAAANIFIIPSIEEGQPKAVLEALASGKPIVATSVPGLKELIIGGENGILVPLNDSDALADAVKAILSSRTLSERLSENAREYALNHFSREAILAEEARLYDDLEAER